MIQIIIAPPHRPF